MAIYHFSVKTISRGNGRSAVACAAYRSGEKLVCDFYGKEQDYTKKTGVEFTEIYAPKNTNTELLNRQTLWNQVEKAERRKDALLAREFEIAFPSELNAEQRKKMLNELCQNLVKKYGVIVDAAIHAPHTDSGSDERNYHAHIMFTTRSINEHGDFSAKKYRDFSRDNGTETVSHWRESFAELCNHHLEQNGFDERVDHRSYQDQESDLEATQHEGPQATYLRRRGIFTEISLKNDEIKRRNLEIKKVIALDENINVSEDLVQKVRSELQFQYSKAEYLEKISQKLSEFQDEELSKLTTELDTMSSEISELRKKEPLFFKTKWINQINDLIDQYNIQLDIQKHISGLSEIEKKERYFEQLNKWAEENQLLQPKKSFEKIDEPNITVKQRKLNDQISNIDHQILEILRREDKYQEHLRDQRLEIINSYIFEEDDYGNKYFSPQNGEKQKRLYAKEMEDLKIQKLHADFIKPIEVEAEQEFAKKRAIQLENDRKDRESREQQLRKEREQQEQRYEQERREQDHMAFLRRQELEKQQKNEPKKPEQDNDNDYTPW
ncbi:MobA/MobL family protein [Acinetobacter baumannii]|uniref:MobQ family relaxase n=2 Tax=Acinetobacter baumannii TaxID=470 RepID=UPI0018DD3462|nr:MobQ family relaxase [Acinetobacter baumannii]MBH8382407.1 MobA/MobL family protein [Acinetobacter baumannii]